MSEIILRNVPVAAEGDTETVGFTIIVEEADWLGRYGRIQVFRSIDGPSGPFEELTDAIWSGPRLPKDGGDSPAVPVTGGLVTIVGETLDIATMGLLLSITFTGSDPLTLAQVASQIIAGSLGRLQSYVDSSGKLVIVGNYPGLLSKLEILESDAAVILGLPITEPDNTAQGRDARIVLTPDVSVYAFRDPFGSRDYHYRTRLYNQVTGEGSDYSISFSANDGLGVQPESTIVGYVELAELTGRARQSAQVYIYNDFTGSVVDGKAISGTGLMQLTDETGRAEFTLVRGQSITVSIQGTALIRTIQVPTDPALSTFNLFDPSIGEVDVFKAAVPDIITAERRTL